MKFPNSYHYSIVSDPYHNVFPTFYSLWFIFYFLFVYLFLYFCLPHQSVSFIRARIYSLFFISLCQAHKLLVYWMPQIIGPLKENTQVKAFPTFQSGDMNSLPVCWTRYITWHHFRYTIYHFNLVCRAFLQIVLNGGPALLSIWGLMNDFDETENGK